MSCAMCKVRGKAWSGSDTICAFDGEFSENWNCATLNAIRDICYERHDLPSSVQYQYCDDQKYATIRIDHIEVDGERFGEALWVSWYKSRGSTDAIWVMDSGRDPRRATERELLAIIAAYATKNESMAP